MELCPCSGIATPGGPELKPWQVITAYALVTRAQSISLKPWK